MKTNFFKIVMSVITVIFAVSESFITRASEKNTRQIIFGYVPSINGFPCTVPVACGNGFSVCTGLVGGLPSQAFGKFHPSDTSCPIFLFRFQ